MASMLSEAAVELLEQFENLKSKVIYNGEVMTEEEAWDVMHEVSPCTRLSVDDAVAESRVAGEIGTLNSKLLHRHYYRRDSSDDEPCHKSVVHNLGLCHGDIVKSSAVSDHYCLVWDTGGDREGEWSWCLRPVGGCGDTDVSFDIYRLLDNPPEHFARIVESRSIRVLTTEDKRSEVDCVKCGEVVGDVGIARAQSVTTMESSCVSRRPSMSCTRCPPSWNCYRIFLRVPATHAIAASLWGPDLPEDAVYKIEIQGGDRRYKSLEILKMFGLPPIVFPEDIPTPTMLKIQNRLFCSLDIFFDEPPNTEASLGDWFRDMGGEKKVVACRSGEVVRRHSVGMSTADTAVSECDSGEFDDDFEDGGQESADEEHALFADTSSDRCYSLLRYPSSSVVIHAFHPEGRRWGFTFFGSLMSQKSTSVDANEHLVDVAQHSDFERFTSLLVSIQQRIISIKCIEYDCEKPGEKFRQRRRHDVVGRLMQQYEMMNAILLRDGGVPTLGDVCDDIFGQVLSFLG